MTGNPNPGEAATRSLPALSAARALAAIAFLATTAVANLLAPTARAAQAPDAGQTLRELQQRPLPVPAPASPNIDTGKPKAGEEPAEARFVVRRINIAGNRAVETAALRPLVSGLEGAERGLAELNAAAERITAYYRERGYPVARAYVPAQDIVDGTVTIAVIEGRVDARRIDNKSRVSDERVAAYLAPVAPGAMVRGTELDRALLLLEDTPGIASSRATLQPGASVGTTDLVVALAPGAPYGGNVSFDTYGNRYTGANRLSGTLNVNSPFGIGDQIVLSALGSNEDLGYGRVAYHRPVGGTGLRVGAAYAETRYRLGKEFSALDASGTASSWSAFAVYPFVRSARASLYGTVTRERKSLTDIVEATATQTDKRVDVTTLGLAGNVQDGLGGFALTTGELTLATGNLAISSPVARAIDDVSARTRGEYLRLSYSASRLQQLTPGHMLLGAVSGQFANKNLDSSEKFALGGAYGVRAYPQGEGLGDRGYLATVEGRRYFSGITYIAVFYDAGMVAINRYPFSTSANTRYLSGAGLGLTTAIYDLQLRTSLAWRTGGGAPVSVPASASQSPLFWLQAVKPF